MHDTYWQVTWNQFKHHRLGYWSFWLVCLFLLVGVYAPFLASSKPLVVEYNGEWYFPLFRYLFYREFFTSYLDLFFNLLMFTGPLFFIFHTRLARITIAILQCIAFGYVLLRSPQDPAVDSALLHTRIEAMHKKEFLPTWDFELAHMNSYAELNTVLRYYLAKQQQENMESYLQAYMKAKNTKETPTIWGRDQQLYQEQLARLKNSSSPLVDAQQKFLEDRQAWLEAQIKQLTHIAMPLFRPFHWEDDAGGSQALNQFIPWYDLTRPGRKDFGAALVFGTRISIVVGITAVALALAIGIPIGAIAGFYGGTADIVICRLMEIWEAMPTLFMLLLIVAITQSKSIFLVIGAIGFFGWTGFSRFLRGEFFKQRNLPYVDSCHAMGFRDGYIMFRHILPNAIPPILTLLPFAVMGAIGTEAGLSFLGLGEEGSCSWGVLMDEGRRAFPGESYLLWPPAIMLTMLLVAIALVGDASRDALDPRLHKAA